MGEKVEVNIMLIDAVDRKLNMIVSDLGGIRAKINNCNSSLQGEWKGKSYNAFVDAYKKLDSNFDASIKNLENMIEALDDVKGNFVERDNELNSLFKNK